MTTTEPLVSVVITCYNYARYVALAIESALAQTYANTEVVVVNDGSTDGSLAIIGRYAGRVRLVDQLNQGSIAAYNAGFAASRGEIVIFLDADDLLCPDAVARVRQVWSISCSKVQYDLAIIDADGNDLGRRFCHFTPDYDAGRVQEAFRKTGTYRWPVTVGNAYSRVFASKVFPLHVDHGPDGILNTLAPLYGEVVTIAAALGAYRLHGANMWTSDGNDHARLPYRIQHRLREVSFMHERARELGVPVAAGNALDHELPFINYRLMAWKLGLEYAGKSQDSPGRLLNHARAAVCAERLPVSRTMAHAAWFLALALVPRALAEPLIQLRFNRAAIRTAARRRLGRLMSPRVAPAVPTSRAKGMA